ncbi:Cytosolic carboxypeptidase 2 [Dinochytrium kinnereticum]|nr:Cytosolic carboxypeptidase 2 [Dinochytrium kinnereticum]
MEVGKEYRFEVVNLMKEGSLYSVGLRPLLYSVAEAVGRGIGWHRSGTNISYFKNNTFADNDPSRPLHTLTFTLTPPHPNDTLYLAHCYPYTYTDLQRDLHDLKSDPERSHLLRHTVIGRGVIGNHVDMISITNPATSPEELGRRRGVVVSARVHPGESNASFMVRGLMRFLTSGREEARELRERFVVKVVPMLNPDGVIIGNYRCNVLGYDLNRQWRKPSEWSSKNTPEIHAIKSMITRTSSAREIVLYCDLHGHNRKQGIFIYGCHNNGPSPPPTRPSSSSTQRKPRRPPSPTKHERPSSSSPPLRYRERVFPLMLSRSTPSLFYFRRCQFKMQRSKEGTGRITVRKEFGVQDSFTLEASFCGSDTGDEGGFHYSVRDLERMGERFGCVLARYLDEGEEEEVRRVWGEVREGFRVGSGEVQPELSESETTSDDEVLRIKVKKKRVKQKDPPPRASRSITQSQSSINETRSRPQSASGSRATFVERHAKAQREVDFKPKIRQAMEQEIRRRPQSALSNVSQVGKSMKAGTNMNPIMLELSVTPIAK